MKGTGSTLYPEGPKTWKSDFHPVVMIAVMLYQLRPGEFSKADSLLEPFTPPKVKYQYALDPAMYTLRLSEYSVVVADPRRSGSATKSINIKTETARI